VLFVKLVHSAVARLKGAPRIAIAIGCLLAGFLIGVLVFVEPWQLNPDLGDLATWLLVPLAAIAGWVGFDQLRLLRDQLEGEQARNVERDKLMDKQLEEAERREVADRRTLIEDVTVDWRREGTGVTGLVENKSRRPISSISCKIMSNVDWKALKLPDGCGELSPVATVELFSPDLKPLQEFGMLRPRSTCIFVFNKLAVTPDMVVVAWFTDDAGFRWQLDEYMHLVQVKDEEEHVYRWHEDPYRRLRDRRAAGANGFTGPHSGCASDDPEASRGAWASEFED
jgi:hypothetical protein